MKQLIFAALLVAAFGLFTFTMRRYVRVLALGAPEPRPRLDQLGRRLWFVFLQFFLQKKVAEGQKKPAAQSLHHLLIFWGFLIITVGTGELLVQGLFPSFNLSLLVGDTLHGALRATIDVCNLLVLSMIGYAVFRRVVLKPQLIPMSLDAAIILGGIALLMLSHFGMHGFAHSTAGPISAWVAERTVGIAPDTRALAHEVSYWLHIAVVLSFMNYLPHSKHIHLLGALPNIALANLSERKLDLPKANLEDEKQWGVGSLEQLSWKSLLDTYACTECARCTNYCPAYATEKPLSPMHLVLDIRDELLERGSLKLELSALEAKLPKANGHRAELEAKIAAVQAKLTALPKLVGGRIKEETLWACTTCGACQEACPVFIEHPLKIIQMRQHLVLAEEKTPPDLARAFRNIERNSNPWGIGADKRMEWAEGLNVPTIADKPNPEYLLWVGCAGAFDQRIRKQTQAMVKVLNAAGVDYAVLGHDEKCTGDLARRGGNEMLFQMQAEANIETLNGAGVKKVITSCPHCLHTLRHDYPQFGGNFEVIHHTALLAHLLETGKVAAKKEVAKDLVYHDSCYMGRWNGEYDAPRALLSRLPIAGQLKEAERSREKSFCCGAGGARMFMEEAPEQRVNVIRTKELIATGAQTIAVGCPFCNVMITDGVKGMDQADNVRVLDVAELLAESLVDVPATAPSATATATATAPPATAPPATAPAS